MDSSEVASQVVLPRPDLQPPLTEGKGNVRREGFEVRRREGDWQRGVKERTEIFKNIQKKKLFY